MKIKPPIVLENLIIHDHTYDEDDLRELQHHFGTHGRGYIELEINEKTRLKDIRAAWAAVKKIQKNIIGFQQRQREKIYDERDKRIVELWKKGLGSTEISKKLDAKFGTVSRQLVANIISDYTKIHGRSRGDFLETTWV